MVTVGDKTDAQLRLLIGLVVFAGLGCVGWAVATVEAPTGAATLYPVAVACLVALSSVQSTPVRIRSQEKALSSASAAILVAVALLPAPWVVICTVCGVAAAKLAARYQPRKIAYNAAKETLAAAAALAAAHLISGGQPLSVAADSPAWTTWLPTLVVAFLTYAVVDEALGLSVIALATRAPWMQIALHDADIRVIARVANLVVATATLLIIDLDARLLVAMPPLVLALHFWTGSRLRTRAERRAWQQLSEATDALNDVDLDQVLRTATRTASTLFSADEVEVEIDLDGSRLVRGDGNAVSYDGPPAGAPRAATPATIERPVEGYEAGNQIGVLRLRFRAAIKLSDRERYALATFATALRTAVHNASAYAELNRFAAANAHAATHDPLTGLPNRRHLLNRAAELLEQRHTAGVTALVLIDLNHFKEVNDTLGHTSGDLVLMAVADRLRAAADAKTLVARLGGDEFALLLGGLPAPAVATFRAEGTLAALAEPIEIDGMRISVEASGGIAVTPNTGGVDEMLRRADVAMYQAKRSGQRVAVYAHDRDTADIGQLSLGGDLARAVAEHQFTVAFQPIVDLGTGEVVAAEALARWHHPDRGSLDPRRFLQAVERSGYLLPAFADDVLDQALAAAVTWRSAGFDLPVSVNVSPRSLLDPQFPAIVTARLGEHGLPPDRLFLEVTETLAISQLAVVDQVLGDLRRAGVRLALDDFGTGYSALSVLSRIAVHELKIDREFVGAMRASAEATAVVRSTIELARALDLEVVAEGVESEDQRQVLWELGCRAGQGHLFARPMTLGRLLAALRRGNDGRPGTLAAALHGEGAVVRMLKPRAEPQIGNEERPDARA
ncbi:MAG TPA: bifunctional diguanylate cyclase/phosphodiesterase [Micromonosporaceae bacterium]|nr:bifunctional diguanylate cyclase/phosphodiesterase [Micromonosporaceae bacterium]